MTKKIYGIYFAYSKYKILPEELYNEYDSKYPSSLAKIATYNNASEQLNAYANTCCAASRLVSANSEKEFNDKIAKLKDNFDNNEWVKEYIDPYI